MVLISKYNKNDFNANNTSELVFYKCLVIYLKDKVFVVEKSDSIVPSASLVKVVSNLPYYICIF